MATSAFTEFTPEKKERFINALAAMPNISRACRLVHISRRTAYNHKETDSDFAAAWDEALSVGVESLEESAWKRAKKGDTALTIFLLKAHKPEKYRDDVKQEHSGEVTIKVVRGGNNDTSA